MTSLDEKLARIIELLERIALKSEALSEGLSLSDPIEVPDSTSEDLWEEAQARAIGAGVKGNESLTKFVSETKFVADSQ